MIKFKLKDKEHSMPTKWEDVTFRQFEQLIKWQEGERNIIQLLSIMTGINVDVLEQTNVVDIDDKLCPFLEFINEPFKEKQFEKKDTINFKGKEYQVPKDLTLHSLNQKITLQTAMIDCINRTQATIEVMPFAVAVYLQPIISGEKFNSDKAKQLEDELRDCKLSEIYGIASFFLQKLIELQLERQPLLRVTQAKNKWQRAFLNWMFSRTLRPSIRSQVEILPSTK